MTKLSDWQKDYKAGNKTCMGLCQEMTAMQ